ncbi:hypothetical protein C922_05772, partial [Plasmodium inui San Antonio 1]
MFVAKISNTADMLDKEYGNPDKLGLTLNEKAILNFAFIYYGSLMDNITNSLIPISAKKPIQQLTYGKTFISSNYFMLSSQIFSLMNLNNLSQLCEYQAISTSICYSGKKLGRFIEKMLLPVIVYLIKLRISRVITNPNEFTTAWSYIKTPSFKHPAITITVHRSLNLYFNTPIGFPSSMRDKLGEQTEHVESLKPSSNPALFGYVFPVNNYIKDSVQSGLTGYTTDRLIKYAETSLLDIKRQGKLEEAMKARLELKKINEHPIIKGLKEDLPMIAPQEYERLQKLNS